jgi:hypothetical protein
MCIRDSFWEEPSLKACLCGNIGTEGARFFEDDGSWWAEDRFPEKLRAVIECGIPWLDSFADPVTFIDLFEKAIDQCTRVEHFFEPGQNEVKPRPSWLKTIQVTAQTPTPPRPAPLYFDLLTLLYHAVGDFERGYSRGQIWMDAVRGMKIPGEPGRTIRNAVQIPGIK